MKANVLVRSPDQLGDTLEVDGAYNWRAGSLDPISFTAGQRFFFVMTPGEYSIVEGVTADANGQVTFKIDPPLAIAPRDNEALIFEESARKG